MKILFSILFAITAVAFEVDIPAPSAILMNADTGAILFEKQSSLPWNPASTTKIATALYVLANEVDLSQVATVSKEALKYKPKGVPSSSWWHEIEGVMVGLKVGEKLSLEALFYGLMMISGNDAANVIAEEVGGTIPQFMEQVNDYLAKIGCKKTHFTNPHGLTDAEHVTTAYDLALIMQKALQYPKFQEVIGTLTYQIPKTNKQPQHEIVAFDQLVQPKSRYYYPKALGGKTGFTAAAKYNLVAAAEHEGRRLIAVVLGSETKVSRYEEAKKLFEAAFAEAKVTRRLMGPENVFAKEIDGSKKGLKASLPHPLSIAFFPAEEPQCKAVLHWQMHSLPIRKGQKVGEVEILDNQSRVLEKGDLIALEELKGNFISGLQDTISRLFR